MSETPPSDDGTAPFKGWPADLQAASTGKKKKSSRGRRHFKNTPGISITSLTDMVTMLLVYLLKTFATNPVEVKDSSIELPHSVCVPDANWKADMPPPDGCGAIDEATIVMITGPQQKRMVNNFVQISTVTPRIVVDGKPVAELDGK